MSWSSYLWEIAQFLELPGREISQGRITGPDGLLTQLAGGVIETALGPS